jgi:hypothetical protein
MIDKSKEVIFCELSQEEMISVEGGGKNSSAYWLGHAVGTIVKGLFEIITWPFTEVAY